MKQSNWSMQWKLWVGAVLAFAALLVYTPALHAQTTATLSGTVTDASGAVVPGAQVTATNESTGSNRDVTSDGAGFFSFPALDPGSYSVKASAKGFNPKQITGIVLHAGDQRGIAAIALAVGTAQQTVTVQAASQIIPVENGAHGAVLDYRDIQNLTMFGQDTTELMKVLPGVTSVPNGLSNGLPSNDEYINVNSSFVGNGMIANGAPYRGGTLQLEDGVDIDDPGCDCSSVATVLPEFTQEMNVQTTNYGAEAQYGPVVVNTTSRSGSDQYHGTGFFYAGNDALNANDWVSNHEKLPKGSAHRYYPGGDVGGPVPFTHKRLLGWFGYEGLFQNEGNGNVAQSFIPTPEMMSGNFSSNNADNNLLCPGGFTSGASDWCNDLSGTKLVDGTTPTPAGGANAGAIIPNRAPYIDPAMKILTAFWPKANVANPSSIPGGYNYVDPVTNIDNGWIIRARADYNMSDKSKFFISYQQGHDSQLAGGNNSRYGAHIYWSPGNSIPFPGGGITQQNYSKTVAGHFVHVFNATTTNEFIASWDHGSFPFVRPNPAAYSPAGLGYNYAPLFNTGSTMAPSYSGGSGYTPNQVFPDFEQTDYFYNGGQYHVYKEMPAFTDTFTKVLGSHTVKVGLFTENVANAQDPFGTPNGEFTFLTYGNIYPDIATGNTFGSPNNPTADLVMGAAASYSQWNKAPLQNMAYQDTSGFVDDSWKVNSRLSLEVGARFDHVGHWYDRAGDGVAVFYADRVLSDWESGKPNPGIYWHGMDSGVPLSGQPNRLGFLSPRVGFSWDTMGTGKTVVRGGWGAYRYSDQNNDLQAALDTAKSVVEYGTPGNHIIQPEELTSAGMEATIPQPKVQSPSGGVNAVSASDYGVPLTYSYNLTIDQQLPWNSLLEVAYVGNSSSQLTMGGEGVQGNAFTAFVNQNKTPMGALFLKDPVTGVVSNNPENVEVDRSTGANTGNNIADYHKFGVDPATGKSIYGTNAINMFTDVGYQNYNGLQLSWEKRAGRLSFNLNGTWSKTLGTVQERDPFVLHNNYGPAGSDRHYVFNSSYIYSLGDVSHGSQVLQQVVNGWQISGTSTWQSGGYLPQLLGNGIPNFGLGLKYINGPGTNGVGTSLGGNTYFGTDTAPVIMQNLKCNPNNGRAHYQQITLGCFAVPALIPGNAGPTGIAWTGQQGGNAWPYMSGPSYFDNDLALFKTFQIHGSNNIQFRAEVYNWLNHPLVAYSSQNQVQQIYNVDYNTGAVTNNFSSGQTQPANTYAVTDTKTGYPTERTMMLVVKYNF